MFLSDSKKTRKIRGYSYRYVFLVIAYLTTNYMVLSADDSTQIISNTTQSIPSEFDLASHQHETDIVQLEQTSQPATQRKILQKKVFLADSQPTIEPDTNISIKNKNLSASSLISGTTNRKSELWLINTRSMSADCPAKSLERFSIHKYDDCVWKKKTLAAFTKHNPDPLPVCFVIHGNVTDSETAINFGFIAYHQLKCVSERPFRLVIWSWPSERTKVRIVKDIFLKSERCDVQGFYLAGIIEHLQRETVVSFIGYSFGARVIAAALQLLNEGTVNRKLLMYDLDDEVISRDYRVVFFAAGLRNSDLLPNRRFGNSMQTTSKALITRNCKDFALRLFPLVDTNKSQALGYTGLVGRAQIESLGTSVKEYSVANSIGSAHDWRKYFSSKWLMNKSADTLFHESEEP